MNGNHELAARPLLKDRTKHFALRVIRLASSLPHRGPASVIAKQITRSGTSVGANYRAACRARSPKDMLAKLKIVEEETDETLYWFELLVEAGFVRARRLESLMDEANQILAMTVSSIRTLRRHPKRTKHM